MFRSRYIAISVSLAALAGAGAAAAVGAQGAAAAPGHKAAGGAMAVKLASIKVSGKARKVLVDGAGKPVYVLTGDSTTHPKCTNRTCLSVWPAVTTGARKPVLGRGVRGRIRVWRHDHIAQITLNGHPLYTYYGDSPGASSGEGLKSFGGTWELLTAGGSPMAKGSSRSGGSSGGGSGW